MELAGRTRRGDKDLRRQRSTVRAGEMFHSTPPPDLIFRPALPSRPDTARGQRSTMKACGVSRAQPEVTLLELPEPTPPGPGQILVAVEAAGVGPWDVLEIDSSWDVGLRPPAALGVEGAGNVLAVGTGVTRFSVGDRVLAHAAPLPGGSGFWAERILINADHAAACPPELDAAHAAALPVNGLTALQALEKLDLSPGQRLLITNGAGATGALAVQLAAAQGIEVTATASATGAERLIGLGAREVVDYHDPHWTTQVRDGFDAALIIAAGTAVEALPLVRDGGWLCSLTSDAPAEERGITSWDLYIEPNGAQLAQLAQQAATGTLKLAPEPMPLSEGPAAFTRVVAGRAGGKKIVLIPG
ncbi:NADP-dependent oxidoreductase [Streptomyces sp. NPDC051014]|uniref:NADP-dependent oxidoreductase n=1 Tax=Streptomyces sp. NPDC051014 TaxID=3155751 RepID=UPI00340D83F2